MMMATKDKKTETMIHNLIWQLHLKLSTYSGANNYIYPNRILSYTTLSSPIVKLFRDIKSIGS